MNTLMTASLLPVLLTLASFSSLASIVPDSTTGTLHLPDTVASPRLKADYGQLPLSFELNRGQSDRQVKFLSRGQGYSLFLTPAEAVMSLAKPVSARPSAGTQTLAAKTTQPDASVIRLQLIGANTEPKLEGLKRLPGTSNYFTGTDIKHWHSDVPHYAQVKYHEVYPGIDMVYYGNQRQLEYDFIVAPGINPKTIRLGFSGVDKLSLNSQGDLILHTAQGQMTQQQPVIYQTKEGKRQSIAGHYVIEDKQQVSLRIASYDTKQPLIIDPILVYSTYLGGTFADIGESIAVDREGNAYITGLTASTDFPTVNAQQKSKGAGFLDVFITNLDAKGTERVYSTYLGGSGDDTSNDIAVDDEGNVYVTGFSDSTFTEHDFPITSGALKSEVEDGGSFVAKLNAAGNELSYSTYVSGGASAIAVDKTGNVYLTGNASSGDFTITPGAVQRSAPENTWSTFVTKLDAQGSALAYSTFLGASGDAGRDIVVDDAGNIYITGSTQDPNFPVTEKAFQREFGGGYSDAFVTKLNAAGTEVIYATYLGGEGQEQATAIAVDADGNAYVTGDGEPPGFPTTPEVYRSKPTESIDVFVAKLDADGSALIYSTYLGGGLSQESNDLGLNEERAAAIAVDAAGNAYITGKTLSIDFPTTEDAFDRSCGSDGLCNNSAERGGAYADAFLSVLNASGSDLLYST